MSIIINNNKKFIIDRTLPEIAKRSEKINENMAGKFLTLLKKIGVDLVEINKFTLDKIKVLPEDLDYIYRVDDISNIYFLDKYKYKFQYVALDYKKVLSLDDSILSKLKDKKIILEIDIKVLDKLFADANNKIFDKLCIDSIVVREVVKYNLSGWNKLIEKIKKQFSVNVGFCACNKFYMATAVSMEVYADGADFVIAAFNGATYGFASLEEIMLGIKVIKEVQISGDLKCTGELTEAYKELTGENVYCMKPVIGEDIFKCESGIHVDGIEKNPNTYEPYDPDEIGAKRSMYIGKHSGKKAVEVKLDSLKIKYDDLDMVEFLKKVREASIKLRRNIFDDELVEIYNDFKNACLK